MTEKQNGGSRILKQLLLPVIVIIVVLALLIMGSLGGIFYSNYEKSVERDSLTATSLIADNVASFVSEAYAISEGLAADPVILTMETEKQTPVLKDCVARNPYLELLYVQDASGMQTGRSSGDLADRSERWWFQQMLADKVPFVSQSYYSVNTGSPCASIFIPMLDGSEFVGVFGADLKLDSLVDLVAAYSDDKNEKTVFIIDGEGTVVAHPDKTYIEELYNYAENTRTVSVKDASGNVKLDGDGNVVEETVPISVSDSFDGMIKAVMNGSKGNGIVKVNGAKYYAAYVPIRMDGQSASWSVISLQRRYALMKPFYIVLASACLVSVLAVIAAVLLVRLSVSRITTPLIQLTRLIGEVSDGDFTARAEVVDDSSEIGALAGSFNMMTEKVARVLGETIRLVEDVRSSSNTLSDLSNDSDQMADHMQQISGNAAGQSADAERVVVLSEQLKECTEQLTQLSDQLTHQADDNRDLTSEGLSQLSLLKKKSKESLEAVTTSYDRVRALHDSSEQIGVIIEEINNISSETELLSLNASIEAARAGSAGKGFAVVASEVSKLASHSAKATESISGIVTNLQEEIRDIVELIDQIRQVFDEQIAAVDGVAGSYEELKDFSDRSIETARELGELIHTAHDVNEEVSDVIQGIHELSVETEMNARTTGEGIARQTDDIRLIAQKVENMNAASDILEMEMTHFTV
ncbi:MAG: methyl-accepting chemotaxis protein [Lachnospiraceae bacterium]|nr:methyl-accepting chemotaxis protein [Lachnospiraceae bacterium]